MSPPGPTLYQAEPEVQQDEVQASQLAVQWLVPQEELKGFIEWNHPRYSRLEVTKFAENKTAIPELLWAS